MDDDRSVSAHYSLSNPFPQKWPTELDQDDDEVPETVGIRHTRSRSRYSALERSVSDRKSFIPGSQKTSEGKANLVQKDEPDPMGANISVVQAARNCGLPEVERDARLRNKFLLSSTTFSPAYFLTHTHANDSTDDLIKGLQYLSRSIDQKSASLKSLVETNFERFVRAKATIDNVYTEMRNQGLPVNAGSPSPLSPRHSHRNSGVHFRNLSSGNATGMAVQSQKPSKNALRRETDYGVQGIKGPLLEVSQRAEEVWGPALGGKERETNLQAIVNAVDKDRALYELGSSLSDAILRHDHDKAVDLYTAARRYAAESKAMGEMVSQTGRTLSDDQVNRILVTGRMWMDVEEQVKTLRRDVWRRLSNPPEPLSGTTQVDEHMELISVLLHLGVEENPIWIYLLSRHDYLKNKIAAVVERSKIEIEIMRRRLSLVERPSSETVAEFLRQAGKERPGALDTTDAVEFWNCIRMYFTKLLSRSSGLLGEVIDFWDSAKSFIDGSKQRNLPTGYEGESKKHHHLADSDVDALRKGTVDLVNQLRDAVYTLFADPPTDDISALFSPTPSSAQTPTTPSFGMFSPSEGRVGRLDPENLPAAAAKKGEPWEDFAFWPPNSNALSAVQHLSKVLALVAIAAGDMVSLSPVASNQALQEKIKIMSAVARERGMRAVCEAWSKDAESCRSLEDWVRAPEQRDQTRMPAYFEAFEKKVLIGIQQVLYFADAAPTAGGRDLISPPSSKLLQMVRTQFVSSIYKAVSGMLDNAEASRQSDEDDWVLVTATPEHLAAEMNTPNAVQHDAINTRSRNVRILVTMSNLKALLATSVPRLIKLFESSFSVNLDSESATIRDVFSQINAKLFAVYNKPIVASLVSTIKNGINHPDWAPTGAGRPDRVSPYVYACLMILVSVHTEVSTTLPVTPTSPPILTLVLSHLNEHVSQALLDGFKERKTNSYTLPALMQATLDTEFIAQTMSQYNTTKAGEIQGQIYAELDKRTTNDARARLQQELGDMRGVLKKLREGSRSSFSCFKKVRTTTEKPRVERRTTAMPP